MTKSTVPFPGGRFCTCFFLLKSTDRRIVFLQMVCQLECILTNLAFIRAQTQLNMAIMTLHSNCLFLFELFLHVSSGRGERPFVFSCSRWLGRPGGLKYWYSYWDRKVRRIGRHGGLNYEYDGLKYWYYYFVKRGLQWMVATPFRHLTRYWVFELNIQ